MTRSALAAGGLLVALVLAELALRGPLRPSDGVVRDRAWQVETRAMHAQLHQVSEVPRLTYAPVPGASVAMPYGEAVFDDRGLRPTGRAEQPGDRRVLVLGDSVVWGELLAGDETVPAALDRALGPGHHVLNGGVTGYDTAQSVLRYTTDLHDLGADVVVLVHCLNDELIRSGPFQLYAGPEDRAREAAERAWLDEVAPLRNETLNRAWLRERTGAGLRAA